MIIKRRNAGNTFTAGAFWDYDILIAVAAPGDRMEDGFMKRFVTILMFALLVFICGPAAATPPPALWLNQPPPDFSLENTGGKKVSLSQFKGKNPVVVAFWHPQQDTSVKQLQELKKVLNDKAFKNVKVLAITTGKEVKDRDAAKAKFKEAGLDFPILFEKRADASATPVTYTVSHLPAFFVVDKSGNLVSPGIGFLSEQVAGKSFKQFLKDALGGKALNACALAPPERLDEEPYKKLFGMMGKPAPDFSATDTDGVKQSLSFYKGKKNVLLIFFYPACPHCRREVPQLHLYNEKWARKQGVQLLAVNIDESAQSKTDAIKFFKLYDMKFPLINQNKDEVSGKYSVQSVPTLFLIDKKGVVRRVFVGEFDLPGDVIHCLADTLK